MRSDTYGVAVKLTGNTAGQTTLAGSTFVLAGGSNVTLSASSNTLTIIGGAGGTGGAAASLFSNANGVSWGTSGTVVTATVATNYAAAVHTHPYAVTDRSAFWAQGGIAVSTAAPSPEAQYSDWVAGSSGYWGWIQIP